MAKGSNNAPLQNRPGNTPASLTAERVSKSVKTQTGGLSADLLQEYDPAATNIVPLSASPQAVYNQLMAAAAAGGAQPSPTVNQPPAPATPAPSAHRTGLLDIIASVAPNQYQPLLKAAVIAMVGVLFYVAVSTGIWLWNDTHDTVVYQSVRTNHLVAFVGHQGEMPGNPNTASVFTAENINSFLTTKECPGGNCDRAMILPAVPLLGDNGKSHGDLHIADLNGDGKPELIVVISGPSRDPVGVIYVNDVVKDKQGGVVKDALGNPIYEYRAITSDIEQAQMQAAYNGWQSAQATPTGGR